MSKKNQPYCINIDYVARDLCEIIALAEHNLVESGNYLAAGMLEGSDVAIHTTCEGKSGDIILIIYPKRALPANDEATAAARTALQTELARPVELYKGVSLAAVYLIYGNDIRWHKQPKGLLER